MRAVEAAVDSVTKEEFQAQFATVRLLVEEAHANLNLKDTDGRTALDFAMLGDHPELIDYLRRHGATGRTRRRPPL